MDSCTIWAPSAEQTASAGSSLAQTLYVSPVTLLLRGELGAGKTTFLQGFLRALGVSDSVTSPTYALEQRYPLPGGHELLHLDLYRLKPADARALVASSDDHSGIRCIEWPDRIDATAFHDTPTIDIAFTESNSGRSIMCTFHDDPLPDREQILYWREEMQLSPHIARHCDTVADVCKSLADALIAQGTIVRSLALTRSAELHDLFRFLDFRDGANPGNVTVTDAQRTHWQILREQFPDMHHEQACATFLRRLHFPMLADIVEPHGLTLPTPDRTRIEQKLLFYADKRVAEDHIVTLEERFADFARRYGKGKTSPQHEAWMREVRALEAELFPAGVPI